MRRSFLWLCLMSFAASSLAASPLSELRGILRDEGGNPVANLALSLVRAGTRQSLRSDLLGQFAFRNLSAGDYAIEIETTRFKNLASSRVSLKPGEKAFLTVMLQQVLDMDAGPDATKNYEARTILRDHADGRMIFRNIDPGSGEAVGAALFRSNGVVEVYSGALPEGPNLSSIPDGPSAGVLTHFAYSEELGDRASYQFAGRWVAGNSSLWKIQSSLRYQPAPDHRVELLLGYRRLGLAGLGAPLATEPERLGSHPELAGPSATARVLTMHLKHNWAPTDAISFTYGLETDRFTGTSAKTFVSPEFQTSWQPWSGGTLATRVTARRTTWDNTLMLPNGEFVEMADSVEVNRTPQNLRAGTNRHYEISGSQRFGAASGEVALFRDQLEGVGLLIRDLEHKTAVYDSRFHPSLQSGVRAGVSGGTGSVAYAVGYVYASSVGLDRTFALMQSVEDAMRTHRYHALTGQLQGTIPGIGTVVTGIIRVVSGRPVATIDLFNDSWNVSNQSVNFFVRQVIPLPDLLGFSPRLEALLDMRNILNRDLGVIRTEQGEFVLVRNPRTVRGGIALNF